ncbi:MAG TPA: hypothetical protein VG711_12030 [Phycisphaerales bacterium]|nr:hypothetical protein [Phycisphaerales bacterium]
MADIPSSAPQHSPPKPPAFWDTVRGIQSLWSLVAGLCIALVSGTVFIVSKYNSVTNRLDILEARSPSSAADNPSSAAPDPQIASLQQQLKDLQSSIQQLRADQSRISASQSDPPHTSSTPPETHSSSDHATQPTNSGPPANASTNDAPRPLATLDVDGIHYVVTSLTQQSGELILCLTATTSAPPRSDVQFTASPAYFYDGSSQTKYAATSVALNDETGTASIRVHFLPNIPVKITFHFKSPADKLTIIPELQIRAGASKPTFNNLPISSAP